MNDEHARQHRREAAQIIAISTGIGLTPSKRRAAPKQEAVPDYTRPHVEIHADFGAEGFFVEMSDQPLAAGSSSAPATEGTRYLEIMYGDDQ